MKRGPLVPILVLAVVGLAGTARADIVVWDGQKLLTGFQVAGHAQTINGATFTNISPQTTGTGYVDPFLKLTSNQTFEQAYNYDSLHLADLQPDGSYGSSNWTRLIWSESLAVENGFWTFVLDIDQTGSNSFYSLDQLVFSWSSSSLNPGTGAYPGIPDLGTPFYDMDAGLNVALGLNYRLNPGSGSGDLEVRIPVPAGLPADGAWIYLYHAGGFVGVINDQTGADWGAKSCKPSDVHCAEYINNDGPDEWWVKEGTTPPPPPQVPEPASMLLLGTGLVGAGLALRRRSRHSK